MCIPGPLTRSTSRTKFLNLGTRSPDADSHPIPVCDILRGLYNPRWVRPDTASIFQAEPVTPRVPLLRGTNRSMIACCPYPLPEGNTRGRGGEATQNPPRSFFALMPGRVSVNERHRPPPLPPLTLRFLNLLVWPLSRSQVFAILDFRK